MAASGEPRIRRVLMTGDTVGGVWTFTLELAEALGACGIEVALASLGGPPSAAQIAEASAIPKLSLLPGEFKLEWMEDPWRDVEASGRWLLELEREYRPDVVHLNSFAHGSLPWLAPTVLTAHSCVLSWWRAVKGEAAPASWDRYRRLVESSLRDASVVTAPSAEMGLALKHHYGLERSACRIIPNGRTAAKFESAAKEPFILTAGRIWDEAKNAAAVARVAQTLAWPVYLAGDAPADSGGLEGCHLLGRLSAQEMAGWYARASIYAMPARYEPFGLSILEAALSGCALVLGDIASLRDIWSDAALFIAPDDTEELRETLAILTRDAGLREALSQRARRRAMEFNSARMSRQYFDAYLGAVAIRSSPCVS
jgi:glycogen(starch) synthase